MATSHQVRCINKRDRQNRHERISHIGGLNNDNTRWKLTEEDAITGMEQGKWAFFVQVGQNAVTVIIATHNGRKYLRTDRDTTTLDNLLSLPECP